MLGVFTLIVISCRIEDSGGNGKSRASATEERQRLLAACPAKAQSFSAWRQELAEERGLSRPVYEGDAAFYPIADVAEDYLETLPAEQRGIVVIDSVRKRVIVQVTRDRGKVLTELRTRVEDPKTVTVETVRWSRGELAAFANRIDSVPGSGSWDYGYDGPDDVVKVDVSGDAEGARRKISEVVAPCAFKVRGDVEPVMPQADVPQ